MDITYIPMARGSRLIWRLCSIGSAERRAVAWRPTDHDGGGILRQDP